MTWFTKEQRDLAHNADLAEFVLRTDPDHHIVQGGSVRLYDPWEPRKNDRIKAVSIPKGSSYYKNFKTGEAGDSIDYLVNYLGYSVVDAVFALSGDAVGYTAAQMTQEKSIQPLEFPEPVEGKARQMYGYLCKQRGIPADVVTNLEKAGLLYQSKDHNNLVFVNRDRDFAEIRGTYTSDSPFRSVIQNRPDRYWDFIVGDPKRVYICEAAIDAISLYLLLKKDGKEKDAQYVSISGVANQQKIDRIKDEMMDVIIAVDNDDAGENCRRNNPECPFIKPIHKDWNEDLLLLSTQE